MVWERTTTDNNKLLLLIIITNNNTIYQLAQLKWLLESGFSQWNSCYLKQSHFAIAKKILMEMLHLKFYSEIPNPASCFHPLRGWGWGGGAEEGGAGNSIQCLGLLGLLDGSTVITLLHYCGLLDNHTIHIFHCNNIWFFSLNILSFDYSYFEDMAFVNCRS